MDKSFCFFFQKEALSCVVWAATPGTERYSIRSSMLGWLAVVPDTESSSQSGSL
jgi:hypothetical protein